MKTSKLVVDMLRKRQERIELLEQLLTNSEAQVEHLMKQRKVLREQVVAPLGLRDTWLGLPRTELGRAVPMRGRGGYPRAMARFVNRPEVRMAPMAPATSFLLCTAA